MDLNILSELKLKDGRKEDEKILYFRGKKVGSFSITGLTFMFSFLIDPELLRKIRAFGTDVTESEDHEDRSVKSLISCYFKEKQNFYHNKNIQVKKIARNSKDYSYFKTAQQMIEEHGVTPEDFMRSQLRVFKLLNNGLGVFPKPSQLVTPEAETRLLQFLKESKTSKDKDIDITFSKWELTTPLNENPTFKAYYRRLLNDPDLVTDKEIKYIELLIEARDQDMPKKTADLIAARKLAQGAMNV